MTNIQDQLKESDYFKEFNDDHINLLVEASTVVDYRAGHYLFREGDAADCFFLVVEGRVAVEIYVPNRGPSTVMTVDVGSSVGWSWIFPPYKWHFDGKALTDVSAIKIDGQQIRKACEQDFEFGYRILQRFSHSLIDRLVASRLQIVDLYSCPTEDPE